jgi:hypothetical protein
MCKIQVERAVKTIPDIDSAVTNTTLRYRAQTLGDKICAENGTARAVEVIQNHAK